MATDLYSRQTDQYGGSFTPDGLFVNFAGGGVDLVAAGLVVQSLGWNYAQRAAFLYEVGSPRIYYIGGRTEGQVTLQRVLGPGGLGAAFILRFGNICAVDQNMLSISAGNGFCSTGFTPPTPETYDLKFCLINNVSKNVQAADSLMNQALNMMFASCSSR
jgi:hypothetical protein